MLMMMTDLGTVHKTNPTCHTNDFCEDNGPGLLRPGQLLPLSTKVCSLLLLALSISQKCCTSFEGISPERQREPGIWRALFSHPFPDSAPRLLCGNCACILWCNSFVLPAKAGQYFYCPCSIYICTYIVSTFEANK